MNWKCSIGLHSYKNIGTQYMDCGGWTLSMFARSVDICKKCGQINYTNFDISLNVDKFSKGTWKPSVEQLAKGYFRDLKIRSLIDENKSD